LQNGTQNFSDIGAPPDGGGIVIVNTSPTVINNVITNNRSIRGGGIGINFGSPLIQLNTITGNLGGGGILITGEGSAEILDNVISNNRNVSGGGIYIPGGGASPIIKRNVIKGNSVSLGAQGGGIYMVNSSSPLIVQNLITGNQATTGGGIYWSVSGIRGPILINNTIADNDATFGSGVFADGADDQLELTNNIIVAKPGQTALFCGSFDGGPIIRSNNIFSTDGMAYGGSCSDSTGTNGNISADPLFANPAQGDYHLQQGSPSIDSGDNLAPNLPDADIDGDTRILDGDGNGTAIIDMGVDEFLAPPSFDICLQDESNGNMLKINSTSGQYLFTGYGGITLGGTGNLTVKGSLIILQAHAGDHNVLALIERRLKKAAAIINVPSLGAIFTIVDKNTTDNTCSGT
jgi:parallel beta-helix repeat protein